MPPVNGGILQSYLQLTQLAIVPVRYTTLHHMKGKRVELFAKELALPVIQPAGVADMRPGILGYLYNYLSTCIQAADAVRRRAY